MFKKIAEFKWPRCALLKWYEKGVDAIDERNQLQSFSIESATVLSRWVWAVDFDVSFDVSLQSNNAQPNGVADANDAVRPCKWSSVLAILGNWSTASSKTDFAVSNF